MEYDIQLRPSLEPDGIQLLHQYLVQADPAPGLLRQLQPARMLNEGSLAGVSGFKLPRIYPEARI